MYLVRNVSSQEISLGDLRISLKPGQQQDIDFICSRYVAEQSPSLKVFIKKSMLKVIRKDTPNVRSDTKIKMPAAEFSASKEEILQAIKESEKRTAERQEALIRKHLGDMPKSDSLNPEAMAALQTAIEAIKKITGAAEEKKEDQGIDDSTAIDIQKRTISRIAKNTSGSVKTEDSQSKSNVDKNIEELKKLL